MYISRHIVHSLERLCKLFPAVLVTGARQVGKSTLLMNTQKDAEYKTFDDYVLQESALQDTHGFVSALSPPVILDEIQYVPKIFRSLKIRIDREGQAGAYLMTGSQQFTLMRDVSESLAGRIGILTLSGLSAREIDNVPFHGYFLPTEEYISQRSMSATALDSLKLWQRIWRGCMPKLYAEPDFPPFEYYSGYVKTYIERDVRNLTQVGDELEFIRFLTACAARAGQLLNLSDITRDIGISVPTAKRWLSILSVSGIVYLLQPYSRNINQRVVKTPKLFFMDTGLVAFLCKWTSPETLQSGAMSGQIFENYVVSEIIKSFQNAGMEAPVYFYRDVAKREIDIIIELDGKLYPVEIKKTASPNARDTKHFDALPDAEKGTIICMYENVLTIGGAWVLPVWMI